MAPTEAYERIARAAWQRARSEEYPCPFDGCAGTLRVWVDHEYGEAGGVLSSWPVFEGACDEAFPADMVGWYKIEAGETGLPHVWEIYTTHDADGRQDGGGYEDCGPVNHGSRLNWLCDTRADYDAPEVARLLGMVAERAALRPALPCLPAGE
jgi:hypothetical protein